MGKMDIPKTNLSFRAEEGFWISKNKINSNRISYPDSGNDVHFQVEDNSFWFKHRNKCLTSLFKSYPPPGVLLDIGGGNGAVSSYLQKNGFQTILIEPGVSGALNARKRKLPDVICAETQEIGILPESVPAIGLFDVLEHIENDTNFLDDLKKLLQKEGRLYITVPSGKLFWSDEDTEAGHYRRYSLSEIKGKLKLSGFTVEYSSYFFSLLIFPILLFRSIPSLWGRLQRKKNIKNEHVPSKTVENVFEFLSAFEIRKISLKKNIFYGTSCMIVATKSD